MNNIKVIPTTFKGINYRSRTEARWAVFMDAAGCPFFYEPEGFDLGEHGWYIPDFYLPECDWFLEIKPSVIVPGRESPVEAFAAVTGKRIALFCGPPVMPDDDGGDYDKGAEAFFRPGWAPGWDHPYQFCCCLKCKRVGIEFDARSCRINCNCVVDPEHPYWDKGYNARDPILLRAYSAAANAFRF